jgi:hypothetical protein
MGTQDGIAALTFDPEQMRCLSALLRHGVEFMVVGGYALRFHGHLRLAKDLDILAANNRRNAERLTFALTDILRVAHPNITPEAFEGQSRQVNLATINGHPSSVLQPPLRDQILCAREWVGRQAVRSHFGELSGDVPDA